MLRAIILFLCILCLSSCAKVQYMDEALRLQSYSDETDDRESMISRRQGKIAALVKRIEAGDSLGDLKTKEALLAALEDPVLVENEVEEGLTRWLYRDPVKYFDMPKIYFFVDSQGWVKRWTSVGIVIERKNSSHEPISR